MDSSNFYEYGNNCFNEYANVPLAILVERLCFPVLVGGRALNPGQVHELISYFVEPIVVAILVLLFGVICGGLVIYWFIDKIV